MTMAVPNATEAKYLSSTIMPAHRALHTVHIYHNYCLYTFAPRTPRLHLLVTYAVVSAKPPPIILKFDSRAVPAEPTFYSQSFSHSRSISTYHLPLLNASAKCVDIFSFPLIWLTTSNQPPSGGDGYGNEGMSVTTATPLPPVDDRGDRTNGQLLTWQRSRPNGQRSRLMARRVPLIRLPTKLLRMAKSDAKKRQREII